MLLRIYKKPSTQAASMFKCLLPSFGRVIIHSHTSIKPAVHKISSICRVLCKMACNMAHTAEPCVISRIHHTCKMNVYMCCTPMFCCTLCVCARHRPCCRRCRYRVLCNRNGLIDLTHTAQSRSRTAGVIHSAALCFTRYVCVSVCRWDLCQYNIEIPRYRLA